MIDNIIVMSLEKHAFLCYVSAFKTKRRSLVLVSTAPLSSHSTWFFHWVSFLCLLFLLQNFFCVAFALVSFKPNTCPLLPYSLYSHKGNTSSFLSDHSSSPYFFVFAPSCPLPAQASSSDFDFEKPCSKLRVMSLGMYTLFLQALKCV